ncbi:LemA family protein [Patescibacteria group bacterium]|nr:LemA family protein [Patescibacteria group bacterium]
MEAIFTILITLTIIVLWVSALFDKISFAINLPVTGILLILLFGVLYNTLIKLRTRVREAFADIDVQLKRRYNLIPNLVETVKGYAAHEKEVFEKVTEARTRAMSAKTPVDHAQAENMLTGALKTLFAVSENYPQLRASENFLELQKELRDTEDKIQAARRFYNTNVREYNIKIQSLPDKLIASLFNFKKEDFFEIEEAAVRESVQVKF